MMKLDWIGAISSNDVRHQLYKLLVLLLAAHVVLVTIMSCQPVFAQGAQGSDQSTADALYRKGASAYASGDFGHAISLLEQSLRMYDRLGLKKQEDQTFNALRIVFNAAAQRLKDGNAALSAGDLRSADKTEQQALAIYRSTGRKKDEAVTLSNLGAIALCRGDLQQGVSYYRQAVALFQNLGLKHDVVPIVVDMCEYMLLYGYYSQVEGVANEILTYCREEGMKQQEADLLLILANSRSGLGDYEQATALLLKGRDIYLGLSNIQGLAHTLQGLGAISENLGDYTAAKNAYSQTLLTCRKGNLKLDEAHTLLSLGELEYDHGELIQATDYCEQALAINRSLGRKIEEAQTVLLLGDCMLEEGHLREARAYYQAGGADLDRIGRYYLAVGEPARARAAFLAELSNSEVGLNANATVSSLIGLAQSEEHLGHKSEAVKRYRQATERLEADRNLVHVGGRGRFFEGTAGGFHRTKAYEGLVRCLTHLRRFEEAFLACEHTKARALTESISMSSTENDFDVLPALREQETELSRKITEFKQRKGFGILEVTHWKEIKPLRDQREADLKHLYKEQDDLIKRMRQMCPEYAAMRYPQPMSASELRLYPGEVLLEYEVTDTETIAFVVKARKVVSSWIIPLTRKALEEKIHLFRRGMEKIGQTNGRDGWRDFDSVQAHELYNLLLAPALRLVSQQEHLLVVPDGALCLLPFEALVVEPPHSPIQWAPRPGGGEYPIGLHYVGDDRVLTYWQSGTSLTITRYTRKREIPKNMGVLVVADPIYKSDDVRLTGTSYNTWSAPQNVTAIRGSNDEAFRRQLVDGSTAITAQPGFDRLPDTGEFADHLAHSALAADTLTGVEACESRVLSTRLDKYGLAVLFAMHGDVDTQSSDLHQAALLLSRPDIIGEPPRIKIGDGPERAIDGNLTMSKIMGLRFQCELAGALSCHTGEGGPLAGEGVMNLGRAFQYAGCRSVLISLFSVSGPPTNLLSESLLSDMRNGHRKDDAIFASRKKLREAGYRHPLDWASFVLVGERDEYVITPFHKENRQVKWMRAIVTMSAVLLLWLAVRLLIWWIGHRRDARLSREAVAGQRRDPFPWMRNQD